MRRDFEIRQGIILVQPPHRLDLHNEFDFLGLDYSVEQRTLVLRWRHSRVDRAASAFQPPPDSRDISGSDRLRVVGLTLGQDVRAVTGYEWRGDTLRVWCGLTAPAKGNGGGDSAAKAPWTRPYLVPQRMDIGAPANVEVRYLGQWYE